MAVIDQSRHTLSQPTLPVLRSRLNGKQHCRQLVVCCCQLLLPMTRTMTFTVLYLSCTCPQGPGWVPLSNLDSRQGPEDPQASKGAAQFFQGLAQQAAQAGVAVDVVAVGQAAVNVPLLGGLTQETGGTIFTHQRKPAQACGIPHSHATAVRTAAMHLEGKVA